MKEFRAALLIFFAVIAARLVSEAASCQNGLSPICGVGLTLLIPYVLSAYFIDSVFAEFIYSEDRVSKIVNLIFSLPYIGFILFVIFEFFSSISIVTVEYILSINLVYMVFVFLIVYWLNNKPAVRRLNKAFMVTFLFSILVFQFI